MCSVVVFAVYKEAGCCPRPPRTHCCPHSFHSPSARQRQCKRARTRERRHACAARPTAAAALRLCSSPFYGPASNDDTHVRTSRECTCTGTAVSRQTAHRSYTRFDDSERHGQSEHFTAKIEVASQLRDKVLEVPCGATRRVSRAFGRRPHRAISAKKGAGSGILYRHFECGRKARGFLVDFSAIPFARHLSATLSNPRSCRSFWDRP